MPPVDKETFIILAELATTNVVILIHDGLYCQIEGFSTSSTIIKHLVIKI